MKLQKEDTKKKKQTHAQRDIARDWVTSDRKATRVSATTANQRCENEENERIKLKTKIGKRVGRREMAAAAIVVLVGFFSFLFSHFVVSGFVFSTTGT